LEPGLNYLESAVVVAVRLRAHPLNETFVAPLNLPLNVLATVPSLEKLAPALSLSLMKVGMGREGSGLPRGSVVVSPLRGRLLK